MPKQSKNNKSAQSANLCKSFCYFWLLPKVESLSLQDSNLQSKVALIRSYIIDFIHCLKSLGLDCHALPKASLAMTISSSDSHKFRSRGLDTSLRCVTLSMTNYCHKKKSPVILRAIARSIHFSDLKLKSIRGLCANLKAIRHKFTHFGLLRRFVESPRNDESLHSTPSLRGLCPKQSTIHTTFKGIQMQT